MRALFFLFQSSAFRVKMLELSHLPMVWIRGEPILMWTRDDIWKDAKAARQRALEEGCYSVEILDKIMMDTAACMALDNAATIAEQQGDPAIEDAINELKAAFNLSEKCV